MGIDQYEPYVPSKFKAWIAKNPTMHSVICAAAGLLIGAILF